MPVGRTATFWRRFLQRAAKKKRREGGAVLLPKSLAMRFLLAAFVAALIVLPVSSSILIGLYRDAAMQLFDDALYKDLEKILANAALHDKLAALPETKTYKSNSQKPLTDGKKNASNEIVLNTELIVTAPEGMVGPQGGTFNLLARQSHWQVTSLAPKKQFSLLAPSLVGRLLFLPSASGRGADSEQLFRTTQRSPVRDEDGTRPVLRLLETQFTLGEGNAARAYAFVVAKDVSEIEASITAFRARLAVTFLLLGSVLAAALWMIIRFGLAPLQSMREALSEIRAGRAAILKGDYPSEIQPLQTELNILLKSKENIIERARTHVGNLAHALKTPLSVITNDARAADGPLAQQVSEQAVVMQQQITHYLDRARVAALSDVIGERTDVTQVLLRMKRVLDKIYAAKGLEILVSGEKNIEFRGEQQDFEEMIGNLMDNACKWASRRVSVRTKYKQHTDIGHSKLVVEITDDGPGLTRSEMAAVLKRGKRLDTQTPGSGLGLSIVVDLAQLYDGEFTLSMPTGGGLRARLLLPAAK